MDPERERIQADLRGLVKGDVRCDDVLVHLYATDASIYEITPLAVVLPLTLAERPAKRAVFKNGVLEVRFGAPEVPEPATAAAQ